MEQDLLEWGQAGKIFGLLEGTDEMDEEECRKMVDGIRAFREGITKQMEGLKLQDEGMAIVQDAVAKHPLWALCWMLLWLIQDVVSLILQLLLISL